MQRLLPPWFIRYKFFNSLFLGVSVGAVFTLYKPLDPSIYSLGGMILAFAMLLVARLYSHILNLLWFFRISLFVELVLVVAILFFFLYPYTYTTALLYYISYQVTFVFGSYLVRIETRILQTDRLLSQVDSAKQLGYLTGMGFAYLFYKLLSYQNITDAQIQVYYLHFVLLGIELIVIGLIFQSFSNEDKV